MILMGIGGSKDMTAEEIKSTDSCPEQNDCCPEHVECSIEKALDILGGKWTFLIIRDLFDQPKRFGELRKSLVGVSPKTLSDRLKELEMKNVVTRTAYATIPPTVIYELTDKGHSLKPIIKEMKLWGAKWG
jgi:DNA-binding HxlR family transcriptional regulator